MATHSSISAWRIQWTEEPDGLQSMGSAKSRTRLKQLSLHNYDSFLSYAPVLSSASGATRTQEGGVNPPVSTPSLRTASPRACGQQFSTEADGK